MWYCFGSSSYGGIALVVAHLVVAHLVVLLW